MAMRFLPLSSDQADYMARGRTTSAQLFGHDRTPDLAQLDDLYRYCLSRNWPADTMADRAQVLVLAIGLGDHLVQGHGLAWVWCEADDLADIALHKPGHTAAIWPIAMVARRLTDREETTFEGIIGGIASALSQAEATARPS